MSFCGLRSVSRRFLITLTLSSIVRMGLSEHSAGIAGTWADLWPIKTCGQAAGSITWATLESTSASAVSRLGAKPRRLSYFHHWPGNYRL